jgi:hypothetical protein
MSAILGDAEMLLNKPRHLGETARQLLKRGIMATEEGRGGTNLLCARPLGRPRSGENPTRCKNRSVAGIVRGDDDRRSSVCEIRSKFYSPSRKGFTRVNMKVRQNRHDHATQTHGESPMLTPVHLGAS